jgi:hypothetical protein
MYVGGTCSSTTRAQQTSRRLQTRDLPASRQNTRLRSARRSRLARTSFDGTERVPPFELEGSCHPAAGGAEVFRSSGASSLGAVTRHALRGASTESRREVIGGRDCARRKPPRVCAARRLVARSWFLDVVIDDQHASVPRPRWIHDTPVVALIHQLAREIQFFEMPFPSVTSAATSLSRGGYARTGGYRR